MSPVEKRIAITVLSVAILFAGVALAWRAGSRVDPSPSGPRDAVGAVDDRRRDRGDDAAEADALVRLERRLAQMENVLDELQRDVSRLERSSSRPTSLTSSGDAATAKPNELEAAAWIEELLEDPEALDVVYDALDAERVERESLASAGTSRSATAEHDDAMTALGEALGLTIYQQDGIAEINAEMERRRADLATRAEALLRNPGPLDAEFRELHKELSIEKRAIYAERSERLSDLLGADKLRELRGYENQQNRKQQLIDTLVAPGFPKPAPNPKAKKRPEKK